jgi:DNA uptake protein ComE-like DNA-binding protein
LSWIHGEQSKLLDIKPQPPPGEPARTGVVIAFSGDVNVAKINALPQLLELLTTVPSAITEGFNCRCPVRGTVVPVVANTIVDDVITEATLFAAPPLYTRALAFLVPATTRIGTLIRTYRLPTVEEGREPELWVRFRGDFAVDKSGRAVDAEFVRAKLPTGDRPAPPSPESAFGVQGGLFESWFRPNSDPRPDPDSRAERTREVEPAPEPEVRERERVELAQPELAQPEVAQPELEQPEFEPREFEQPEFEQPPIEQPPIEQPEPRRREPKPSAKRVRINHADIDTLRSLPHIGKALANRISHMRRRKPFKSRDDLRRVEGLSERTINDIAGLISFD